MEYIYLKNKLLSLNDFVVDNTALDQYCHIVADRQCEKDKLSTNAHHIIPRQYFKHKNIEIDDSPENIVHLLYKDHVLAHYYLSQCVTGAYKYGQQYAFLRMCYYNTYKDLEEIDVEKLQQIYEECQHYNSEFHSGKVYSDEYRQKLSQARLGHAVSDETKAKISDSVRGRYKGNIYVFKGDIEKHIKPELLEQYLNDGYTVGRSEKSKQALSNGYNYSVKGMLGKHQSDFQKERAAEALRKTIQKAETRKNMSKARAGKILISNEEQHKSFFIDPQELEKYENMGFHRGKYRK